MNRAMKGTNMLCLPALGSLVACNEGDDTDAARISFQARDYSVWIVSLMTR